MERSTYIAFDIGAESGRAILGLLENGGLSISQLSRFPNEMHSVDGHLHWDVGSLTAHVREALSHAASTGIAPESVAVDTWGVDFGLAGSDGQLLEQPYSYRDHRTDGMMEKFFEIVPRRKIYELTGIQFMQLNSLYQLYAATVMNPALVERASALLFMPDIFNYFLTGERRTEYTIATTSQLLNPHTNTWSTELLSAMGIRPSLMQALIQPGTALGKLARPVSAESGLGEVVVTAVASHDTGSAIAAVPAEGEEWAYISSGTWSLMGVETTAPIINNEALDLNFTNEGGVQGTNRFLKNIMGLWLLQQCRKEWSASVHYEYDELMELAGRARPFSAFLDTDHHDFFHPSSMTGAIQAYCRRTGQKEPQEHSEFVRTILESLALKYRVTLDQLRRLTTKPLNRVHIIGGGAQNQILCQFAANAMGVPVIAGPVEATAIGNVMVQALAVGKVGSLRDIRDVVRRSFSPLRYEPRDLSQWNDAYERYRAHLDHNH